MCLAIPGKVIEIKGKKAVVKYPGEERTVLVGEKGIKEGDYVMVQMGIIINKIGKKQAELSQAAWNKR